jgi:hypothetical protein
MATGADKPDEIIQVATADTGQQAAAASKLHDDSRHLHIVETPAGRLIELNVGAHDTLLNLGRELYRKYAHHDPSTEDLKAFEADASRRNNLPTKYAQDHLHLGQPLTLSLPGVSLPRPATLSKPHMTHPQELAIKAYPANQPSHEPVLHSTAGTQAKVQAKEQAKIAPKVNPVETAHPGAAAPSSEAKAIMKGANSCSGEWSNMVAQWVTHNEVSQQKFLAYNANDHGAGISVGLLQWNQKKGRLPELLQDWHKKDPAKFEHMFGGYSSDLLKADWVRSADFNDNSTLNKGMHAALADSEFQQVQVDLRNQHIVKSCEVAESNGFTSLRGRAVVADLFNQIGERGTVHALHHVPENKPESVRIEALKKVTGGRTNGHDRVSSIEDKVKEVWRKLGTN